MQGLCAGAPRHRHEGDEHLQDHSLLPLDVGHLTHVRLQVHRARLRQRRPAIARPTDKALTTAMTQMTEINMRCAVDTIGDGGDAPLPNAAGTADAPPRDAPAAALPPGGSTNVALSPSTCGRALRYRLLGGVGLRAVLLGNRTAPLLERHGRLFRNAVK